MKHLLLCLILLTGYFADAQTLTMDKKEAACGEKGHQCSEACKKK